MTAFLKDKPLRDPTYLLAIRDMPCLFTGLRANDSESVVPAHIGTAGKGMKSPDNEVLPLSNSVHQRMHRIGEISVLSDAPAHVIRAAFRALARELYAEWAKAKGIQP